MYSVLPTLYSRLLNVFPQDIDFSGFKIFMDIFLEVSTPDDLVKHLFVSFVKLPQTSNPDGKTLKVRS